jgi:hypothetical protein
MRHKITSPRVFIDTLESFFDEHGGHQRIIASAFAQYIHNNWQDYVGSFTDACNVRVILCLSYDLDLPPLNAIEWNLYVNHNASYLGES